jgi:hypothetical protein
MVLVFLKDYRSRAWMCRYHAGAVVEVVNEAVLDECLADGYAVPVVDESTAEIAPVVAPEGPVETPHEDA